MNTKMNYFFLIKISSWPFLNSISFFNFLFSAMIFMKVGQFNSFFFSSISMLLAGFYWWNSYSKEFIFSGNSSLFLEEGVKMGMILFILSEVFFFFSFFWSYFHYLLNPLSELGMEWPPFLVQSFEFFKVPLLNTFLLLSSGMSVTIAHNFLNQKNFQFFSSSLMLTCFLGVMFTFFQVLEYFSSFFSLSDGSFGSSFFVLTGFHGAHVVVGTVYLTYSLMQAKNFNSSNSNFLSFELSSWYWHFVDVVWIFLFFFLYFLPF